MNHGDNFERIFTMASLTAFSFLRNFLKLVDFLDPLFTLRGKTQSPEKSMNKQNIPNCKKNNTILLLNLLLMLYTMAGA